MLERPRAMSNPRLHEIISSSLEKRKSLQNGETSLIRLIDGQGDNLNGHILESYGSGWLISTTGSNLRKDIREILSGYQKPLYWKRLDQHQKESPVHLCGEKLPEFFSGLENGLKCRLSFESGYSQGIFIDSDQMDRFEDKFLRRCKQFHEENGEEDTESRSQQELPE